MTASPATVAAPRFAPIHTPRRDRPMQVVFFASGGPGNLQAAFDVEDAAPALLRIGLVVTDRPGIPSIALARGRGVPVLVRDFEASCGRWTDCRGNPVRERAYVEAGTRFHDAICDELAAHERVRGERFDLAVLAYRRIVRGRLLERFAERMINQHPADLAARGAAGQRLYPGIGGHARALRDGRRGARTTTILVRAGVDDGEILAQGPWVPFTGDARQPLQVAEHEDRQKSASDWPSLRFALAAIASGRLGLATDRHVDGCKVVGLDQRPLPYCGYVCAHDDYQDVLRGVTAEEGR